MTARRETNVERVEAKLDALGRAIGGPALKEAWDAAEANLPKSRRTFKRARCGCWKGSPHQHGCDKFDAADRRRNIA